MRYNVNLCFNYAQGCRLCITQVEDAVAQALRDSTVSGITLKPGPRCDHESREELTARLASAKPGPVAVPTDPTPTPLPLTSAAIPAVEAALNGFDPVGRA